MAHPAAKLVVAAGLLLAGIASAAGRAPTPAEPYPVATDTRVGGDETHTRFIMDLTRKVELRAFALADPYRVVVDLPQVTLDRKSVV